VLGVAAGGLVLSRLQLARALPPGNANNLAEWILLLRFLSTASQTRHRETFRGMRERVEFAAAESNRVGNHPRARDVPLCSRGQIRGKLRQRGIFARALAIQRNNYSTPPSSLFSSQDRTEE